VPKNLIPPVFYTEEMTDPLLQEDLRENLVRPVDNVVYV
jgi:hypothetical protein